MLGWCAELKNLNVGKEIHRTINEQKIAVRKEDSLILSSSLVNMYSKCGSIKNAQDVSFLGGFLSSLFLSCFFLFDFSKVFALSSHRDVISWTSIISAYPIYVTICLIKLLCNCLLISKPTNKIINLNKLFLFLNKWKEVTVCQMPTLMLQYLQPVRI